MSSHLLFRSVLALLAAVSAAPAQRITVLESEGAGRYTVRVFDEAAVAAPGTAFLSGVVPLPIDKTQRTAMADLDPERARLVTRRGLTSIDLPGGGRVLHYRRAGGTRFGYLLVTPQGDPVVLLEQSGTGIGGSTDPFAPQIGVAPGGGHAAFMTTAGVIWLARLDGASYASTGTPSRIVWNGLPFPEEKSLCPGAAAVFFVTEDERIRRCGLADGAVAQDVTPASTGAGARMDDELVLSGDGTKVAFLYGPRDQESIYLVDASGPALRLSPPPSKYEEPGYLPETSGGPFLLLDETGSRLMYIDASIRDEIFVVDTAPAGGSTHITSNANFLPYIGVGILPSFTANELVLAVGDPGAFDYFRATTSAPLVSNLTQTGPNLAPPFDVGTLVPVLGARSRDGDLVAVELTGAGSARIRGLDATAGTTWTADRTLRGLPAIGSGYAAAPSFRIGGLEGDILVDARTGDPILAAPPGIALSPEVADSTGAFSVFVAELTAGPTAAAAILLRAGPILVALDTRAAIEQIGLTAGGGLLVHDGSLIYYGPGGTAILSTAGEIVVLSGAVD